MQKYTDLYTEYINSSLTTEGIIRGNVVQLIIAMCPGNLSLLREQGSIMDGEGLAELLIYECHNDV